MKFRRIFPSGLSHIRSPSPASINNFGNFFDDVASMIGCRKILRYSRNQRNPSIGNRT